MPLPGLRSCDAMKRGNDSCAAQPAVAGHSMKRVTEEEGAPGSGAAQPAGASSPYPTVPLSSLSGHIRQYSVCYPCALGREIHKHILCSSCGNKRETVLMVACPETWPDWRAATCCYRCKCQVGAGETGIYTISRSALSYGNSPVCCQCYGVDTPTRQIQEE